jgi:hypothetical protein
MATACNVPIAAREGFRVTGSNAASTDIGDDLSMRFEWPVSEVHPTL